MRRIWSALLVTWLVLFLAPASAQVNVVTNHNDNARTGANLSETQLNTSNVNVNQFGKLFNHAVDGHIYAQPLVVQNITIPGKGVHNVVYVATMNNSVYAFDADDNAGSNASPLWTVNFNNPGAGITPVPSQEIQHLPNVDFESPVGILGTPVIDEVTGTIYLVARTKEVSGGTTKYVQRLHALDITTGTERFGGPKIVQASIPGTGYDAAAGMIQFNPKTANQRSALTLVNRTVLIAWSAIDDDVDPYHGWVMAYDADTLQQMAVYNSTPHGQRGGIWQSGAGGAADASGYVYYITGNGDWDGSANFGDSVLKLNVSGLILADWFTPDNQLALDQNDLDLGVSGPLLIPGTDLLVHGSKEGKLYLLRTGNLGHLSAGNGQIVQSFLAANGHIHGSPVYYSSPTRGPLVYIWSEGDVLKAFHFNGATLDTTPATQSSFAAPPGMPGGILSVSANGNQAGSGIVWAYLPYADDAVETTVPGVLRAFNASNLTQELWNSRLNLGRDDLGAFAKFCPPTVANGKVYLASFSGQLGVYGLLSTPGAPNIAPLAAVTASSENAADGQQAIKAVDGVADGWPRDYTREWATAGQGVGTWITLSWSLPYLVDHVVLYDRPNTNDQVTGGTLTFSDGTTVSVPSLNNAGAGITVTFAPRTITSVTFTVTSVSATSHNIGLAEFEVYGTQTTVSAPATPTGLTATASASALQISLAWTDNANNEVGYRVERSTDGSNFTTVATLGANAVSYADTALAPTTTYYYRVVAYNSGGSSGYSNTATATTGTVSAPVAPTGLTATASASALQISLAWTDNANNEVGYRVERSTDGTNFAVVATLGANAVSYNDPGLAASTTYYYRVVAYNSGGSSGYSNTATATTTATVSTNIAPLAAVTASSENAATGQQAIKAVDGVVDGYPGDYTREWATAGQGAGAWIKLSWSLPYLVDHVVLYDRPNTNDQVTGGTLTFSDGTTVSVPSLNNAGAGITVTFAPRTITSVTFTVTSVSATSHNIGLAEFEVYGTQTTVSAPATPTGLTATASASALQISLAWTDNANNEVGYRVERSTDGSNFTTVATLGANAVSYADTALAPTTTYYYRVVAYNSGGSSGYSNTATATTGTVSAPVAPTGLTATASASALQISLAWTDNANNEVGYRVERSTDGTNFAVVATLGANAVSYNDPGLAASTTYYYRVVAYNSGGSSGYSNTATATTTATVSTNIAPLAAVTASSENAATGQQAIKAVDGVVDGYPGDYTREWATAGQGAGAWIKLSWSLPYLVDHVVLYDRPNTNDRVTGGTLTFSDGTTVNVPSLNNAGAATTVTFAARTVTSVTFTVTSVSSTTKNIGLAEIEVWGR